MKYRIKIRNKFLKIPCNSWKAESYWTDLYSDGNLKFITHKIRTDDILYIETVDKPTKVVV